MSTLEFNHIKIILHNIIIFETVKYFPFVLYILFLHQYKVQQPIRLELQV